MKHLLIFTLVFFGYNSISQPLLKFPTGLNCSADPEFLTPNANLECNTKFVPSKLFSNIYTKVVWNFGNGVTFDGYDCPAQDFNTLGTFANKVTITNQTDFVVLKSIKVNRINDNWKSATDANPDIYIEFFSEGTLVLKSCNHTDLNVPITFEIPNGFILEKDIKIEQWDADGFANPDDFITSFIIPKNYAGGTLTTTDSEVFVVTEKVKTTTFDFNITVNKPTASISEKRLDCTNVTLTATTQTAYKWSNGSTAKSINVGLGTYTVTITSAAGCTNSATHEVKQIVFKKPDVQCTQAALFCTNYSSFLKWLDKDLKPIFGKTDALFIPDKPGIYYLRYTAGGPDACPTISDGFDWPTCKVLSASEDILAETKVPEIYPNPTSDIIYFKNISNLIGATINLYNISGKLEKSTQITSEDTSIDLIDMANGAYIMQICEKSGLKYHIKVIKI